MGSGKQSVKTDFLVARGAIQGITDIKGLGNHATEVGDYSVRQIEYLKVCLDWGREKEGFAVSAMKRILSSIPRYKDFFDNSVLLETSFTPCTAYGCDLDDPPVLNAKAIDHSDGN
jgi:hypothetical protein